MPMLAYLEHQDCRWWSRAVKSANASAGIVKLLDGPIQGQLRYIMMNRFRVLVRLSTKDNLNLGRSDSCDHGRYREERSSSV